MKILFPDIIIMNNTCARNGTSVFCSMMKSNKNNIGEKEDSVQYELCQCGCGEKTNLDYYGKPRRFCYQHHRRLHPKEYVIDENGCWIWQRGKQSSGYGQTWKNGRRFGSNRYYYEKYKGKIPKGLFVCHKCDVKLCVNPDHLYIASCKENTRDAMRKGLFPKGEKVYNSKLSYEKVKTIRKLRKSGTGVYVLAEIYGVRASTISLVANRKTWKHVQ